MLRAVIIDDEIIGIKTLKLLIEENTKGIRIVATTTEPEEGIDLIEDYKPDILFLDISMPTMNGFELIEKLRYKNFKLVFTTAHNDYAIKAIKQKAADYLLKPIDIEELQACVSSIISDTEAEKPGLKTNSHIIELAVKNGVIFIKPQDIIRLEAAGSYTVFYLANASKEVVSKNLKECESLLEPPYFYRCHPSHIINLHKAVKLVSGDGLYIQMSDGSRAEISRKNKEELLDRLKQI
jgi:two-component system LytT family response regulator